jgi:hypothetical protein
MGNPGSQARVGVEERLHPVLVASKDHDELVPLVLNDLQVAEPVQQIRHQQSHGGLPGSRGAGEAHVQVGPGRGEPELLPDPVDQQQRPDLLNPPLHRHQADELPVESSENLVHRGRPALGGERDHGLRGKPPTPVAPAGPAVAGRYPPG